MPDIKSIEKFIQTNSPDGGFLQSEEWRKFQESIGRRTFRIVGGNFCVSIIEHRLPFVGIYFYIPRGPVIDQTKPSGRMIELVKLAQKENAGWIRFDANNTQVLDIFRKNRRVIKAPHDMQPKEIFIIDIMKPEAQLLAEMKSKTRYNIKLALKHNVKTIKCEKHQATCDRAIDEFVRLVKITAKRDKITPHPDRYYRGMFEIIPEENLKLYLAEYEGKIIAANIVVFYGKVATYLHGASDNNYRNVMAPYLLQWQAILDAKALGCEKYDFGGVQTTEKSDNWSGITRFKMGFSVEAIITKLPGSYDIVMKNLKYNIYKNLQKIKTFFY